LNWKSYRYEDAQADRGLFRSLPAANAFTLNWITWHAIDRDTLLNIVAKFNHVHLESCLGIFDRARALAEVFQIICKSSTSRSFKA
ncbi:hypothetical protein PFISCL1PPCAC_3042, partial [Pristionchus fissidentatus]